MSTHGQFNTRNPTIKRILKEASELSSSPSADYHAAPLDDNLFEWHFTLLGPPSTPYSTGMYHGRIILPPTYPLRPPSFRFLTPSGRFEPNREICLSISGHHEETWQPAWGIRTALVALRAFMGEESKGMVGGMEAAEGVRKRLASEARAWRCGGCGGRSNEEVMKEVADRLEEEGRAEKAKTGAAEEVPEGLRLGYREDIEGAVKSGSSPSEQQQKKPSLSSSTPPAASLSQSQSQPPPSLPTTDTDTGIGTGMGLARTTASPHAQPQPQPQPQPQQQATSLPPSSRPPTTQPSIHPPPPPPTRTTLTPDPNPTPPIQHPSTSASPPSVPTQRTSPSRTTTTTSTPTPRTIRPTPTTTTTTTTTTATATAATAAVLEPSTPWLDKTIYAVLAALVALIVRKIVS
ncbi:MAG: hypothetical protein M1819_007001 [Sarea resinae]|nr:MAG: hypothetical protein M1819_007001 [Sarea resinae]